MFHEQYTGFRRETYYTKECNHPLIEERKIKLYNKLLDVCLYEINGFKLDVVKVRLNRISELSKRSTAEWKLNYVIIRGKGIGK